MQDLWIPYFTITTDITASTMRVHTDGKCAGSLLQRTLNRDVRLKKPLVPVVFILFQFAFPFVSPSSVICWAAAYGSTHNKEQSCGEEINWGAEFTV